MTGPESRAELFTIPKTKQHDGFRAPTMIFPIERAAQVEAEFDAEALPPTPDSPEVLEQLLRNALLLIDNGDLKNAMGILRNVLTRHPHNPDAIEWMGYCLSKTGDLSNALKCYQELLKVHPDEYSYSALGETLYLLGRETEAEDCFRKALSAVVYESPVLFNIHKNLGNISIKAGDLDAAEENYNKAYALCPHSDSLLVNLGTLELQRGNLDAALDRYRAAVELNAQNDKAWVGIALIHREMGDFELSWGNIEKALDINLSNKTALRLFVEWCFQELQSSKAIDRLELFLGTNGDDFDVSIWLAEAYFRNGELSQAHVELARARALRPEDDQTDRLEAVMYGAGFSR